MVDSVTYRIASDVAQELAIRVPDVHRLEELYESGHLDPRQAAAVLVPSAETWDAEIGPFLDAKAVQILLGEPDRPISKQAISKRRDLLALRTGSDRVAYPRFQFRGKRVLPGLGQVLRALPESLVSRWTVASWLMTPQPTFDSDRPADLLADGVVEPVVEEAKEWAAALAH